MSLRTHSLSLTVSILAGALLMAAPGRIARAGNVAPVESANASLQAERRKLVGDLERANAEIEQLKKKDRGVRDDYRLRARMADAEAIARRLTEIDAKLGPAASAASAPNRRTMPPVGDAAPTDGPAELEARADILADQSRRLEAQAATLSQRVTGMRNRIELRRRTGQLEADPFAPMEGSKRRLIATVPGASPTTPTGNNAGVPTSSRGAPGNSDMGAAPVSTPPSTSTTAPGNPQSGSGAMGPGPAISTPESAATPAVSGGARAPVPTVPTASGGTGGASDSGAALSAQLRDFLDPGALAAIRKLEATGTPTANLEAMARAAAALRERAQKLQVQSNSLRQRAQGR